MNAIFIATVLAVGLFVGIVAMLELGRRLGIRRLASDTAGAQTGTGAVEGAVFALVGLLIAFTFSGAASRFDARRDLIVAETNAIGTAWLRLDLLPAAQPAIRDSFLEYLDARLAVYRKLPDMEAAHAELAHATTLQATIWAQALAAGQREGASPDAIKLLLPALNDMFDIATTRTMATQTHPPFVIYGMLTVLALASALLAGFGMAGSKSRSWLHILGFAAVMAVAVYVIIDLEFPRLGLIRVDTFDQVLVELRASMK
jgi:CDP-diglyceride synthetase